MDTMSSVEKEKPLDDPSRLSVRHRLRFLAKDSVLYGGAAAFNKAFALVTFPLLTRHFSVETYGAFDFLTVLAALLTTSFIFGQDSAVARYFYEYKDHARRQQVISQSLALQGMLVAALLPLLWLTVKEWAALVSAEQYDPGLLRLVLLQVPGLILINFSQNILKWTFQRSRFLLVSIGSMVVSVVALLVAVSAYQVELFGVLTVYLITQAAFGLIGLWFVRRWLALPREWQVMQQMLRFAIPFGLIGVVSAAVPTVQRTLIQSALGARELGLFAAGSKIAILIALPVRAMQVAWGPFSLAIFREPDAARTYNWVLKLFAIGLLSAVLALTAIAEPSVRVLASNRYAGSSVVVFALALGMAVEAIGWITAIGIGFSERSYLSLVSYAAFLTTTLLAIWGLMPIAGVAGVAWGGCLGFVAKSAVESWLGQRAHPLAWQYGGVLKLLLGVIAIGAVSQLVARAYDYRMGSIVAGLGVPVVFMIGWRSVLTAYERQRLLDAIQETVRALRKP